MATSDPDRGGLLDPEGAMEELQAWKGRVDQLAANTTAMSDRLEQLQVTVKDSNGLAEVTIDSRGVLVDLQFTQRIQRVAPEIVSRSVMNAISEARQEVAERAQEIVVETLGADSKAARAIADRVGQQLRGPGLDDSTHDGGR